MATIRISPQTKMIASRKRMANLVAKMQVESDLYDTLLLEIELDLQTAMGQDVRLMVGGVRPHSQTEGVVFNTIKALHNGGHSYEEIATKLNTRSLKTKTLCSWTGILVKEFYENYEIETPRVMRAGA
jgi:hypothetical protein